MSISAETILDRLIDACGPIIETVANETDDSAIQNSAVSSFGISVAVATLRNVTNEQVARKIAALLVAEFATEVMSTVEEIWGDREQPQ